MRVKVLKTSLIKLEPDCGADNALIEGWGDQSVRVASQGVVVPGGIHDMTLEFSPHKPKTDAEAEVVGLREKVAALEAEIKTDNALLDLFNTVLVEIPECPVHGQCVPYAVEWVKMARLLMASEERDVSDKHG